MAKISERSLEDASELVLLLRGPDDPRADAKAARETPPPYGENVPGGYARRRSEDYDRRLCLIPRDVLDFIYASQPKEWEKLTQHHGAEVKERFLKRLASEIVQRGTLDVLRQATKDSGCKFQLTFFRPSSGLNVELQRLYEANLFSVVRQLHYSERNDKSLDIVLFLNGVPIFTAELKNPFTGQNIQDAIRQYRFDRDPREPFSDSGGVSPTSPWIPTWCT